VLQAAIASLQSHDPTKPAPPANERSTSHAPTPNADSSNAGIADL
jgi:hypothetical protein